MIHLEHARWSPEEDAYLMCPIPSAYLAVGALAHRTAESIRWRRRRLSINIPVSIGAFFVPLVTTRGTRGKSICDFPLVDWDKPLWHLQDVTGCCQRTVWALRKQAIDAGLIDRPFRKGRRKLQRDDFPGVDWTAPTREIMEETKLSRPTVTRLKREL